MGVLWVDMQGICMALSTACHTLCVKKCNVIFNHLIMFMCDKFYSKTLLDAGNIRHT